MDEKRTGHICRWGCRLQNSGKKFLTLPKKIAQVRLNCLVLHIVKGILCLDPPNSKCPSRHQGQKGLLPFMLPRINDRGYRHHAISTDPARLQPTVYQPTNQCRNSEWPFAKSPFFTSIDRAGAEGPARGRADRLERHQFETGFQLW